MPDKPWEQAGIQAAGQLAGTAMGMLAGGIENKRQLKQQKKLNKMNFEQHKLYTDYNTKAQMEMWERTNYKAQMDQLKKAGLNPALMYEGGGAGGTTQAATGGEAQATATRGTETIQGMGMGLQMGMMQAQLRLINAQAKKAEADAELTAGAQTGNIEADTENKILQAIILEYTGKEAKSVYENVKEPNRAIEAKTYQDEMEARQGVAGTIYELWVDGKLKEKGLAEIEAIALGNAKSRAEKAKIMQEIDLLEANLKGKNIENAIAELEMKMQKQTGVDKASPTWMKVLARLYIGLMGK